MEDKKTDEAQPDIALDEVHDQEVTTTNIETENSTPNETQLPIDPVPPVLTPATTNGVVSKKKLNKKTLIIILVTVVVLAGGLAGFYYFKKPEKTNNSTNSSTQVTDKKQTSEAKPEAPIDPALKKLSEPSTGETWLSARKPVADLGYIKTSPGDGVELKYYEVGKRAGNSIYLSSEFMLGELIYLFEKSPTGEVRMIGRPSSTATYNDEEQKSSKNSINSTVIFDEQIHYDSLSVPSKITLKNGYDINLDKYSLLGSSYDSDSDQKSGTKYTTLEKYGSSSLQKAEFTSSDTNLTSISYHVTLPIGTRVMMSYEPLSTDASKIKFVTGQPGVTDTLSAITRGCGRSLTSVSRYDLAKDADFKEAGTAYSNQKIYEANDVNYPMVTKAYQEFMDYYSSDASKKSTTKDEFFKAHAVVFFKDKDGQWLVYIRGEYQAVGGCAKPVVYLYPTSAQYVDVKVGADVKVSDPLYDKSSGWKNVWVDPSGLLTLKNKSYSSLFWEGPGYGQYPNITEGTVVPTSQAISTIKSQLQAQNFNTKEIADFLEYWTPNMPKTKYIRITWLNTEQMNKLAPLNVNPKPDTVIRTFLDFQGLDSPVNLLPQNLKSIPRTGFTLVEWGGLSAKKLY